MGYWRCDYPGVCLEYLLEMHHESCKDSERFLAAMIEGCPGMNLEGLGDQSISTFFQRILPFYPIMLEVQTLINQWAIEASGAKKPW